MSSSDDINRKRRNKPCENCRAHRRKCAITEDGQCKRCIKMGLVCVFKYTAKPTVIKKSVPISKKTRLLEQVRTLEEELASMEEQLRYLNVRAKLEATSTTTTTKTTSDSCHSPGTCDCTDPFHCQHSTAIKRVRHEDNTISGAVTPNTKQDHSNNNWQLVVRQGKKGGLQFQTHIKNVADVVTFVNETLHYFTAYDVAPFRTPQYHIDRSCQQLTITNKLLKLESVLHSVFKKNVEMKAQPKVILDFDDATIRNLQRQHQQQQHLTSFYSNRNRLKKELIRLYFNCSGQTYFIFSKPNFLPFFEAQFNSMTASAIAAFITYSQCRHVPAIISPLSREAVAESFRQEAKDMLEEVLFEEEPNLMTVATLMLLCQCALITLQNKEARLYISLAWRLVIQLKDKYISIVQTLKEDDEEAIVTPDVVMAETWRRLFYAVRYLEVTLFLIHDGSADCSPFVLGSGGIGYPMVLANERPFKDCVDAVKASHYVVQLQTCQLSTQADELNYQLLAGSLDSIAVSDIERLENQLVNFWKSLPASFRLSDSPLEHVQMDRIQQCDNPHAIYLNQLYYAYWLGLQTRLMRDPSSAETLDVDMNRFDGDRALFLVSVCCDSLAKIFHVLFCRLPCSVELHWLLVAIDAMSMLKTAANKHIRILAEKNFEMTMHVLKQRIQSVSSQSTTFTAATTATTISHQDLPVDNHLWINNNHNHNHNDSTDAISSSTGTSTSEVHTFKSEHDSSDEQYDCSSSSMATSRPPAPYFGELKRTLKTYFAEYDNMPHT